jgi:two-component system cell cycle sensor histidine kinase/response regulator CckA
MGNFRVPEPTAASGDTDGSQEPHLPSRQASKLRLLAPVAGGASAVIGVVVLLGWLLDIGGLRTFLPAVTNPMVASTGACFALLGASLWLLRDEGVRGPKWWIGKGCAFGAAIIGVLKLGEYQFGWYFGAAQPLVTETAGSFPVPTAFSLLLIGAALLFLDRETSPGRWPAQMLTLVAAIFPLMGLLGRVYGVPTLSRLVSGTAIMALPTALTFLLVCAGVLAARPTRGLMMIAASDGPGGLLLRRLLPGSIGVMVLAGWIRLMGETSGLYPAEFGVALFAIFSIVLLTMLIGRTARSLYRSDLEHKRAEEKLRQSEQEQRAILSSIAEAVVITDGKGVVVSINRAMERLAGWREEDVRGRAYDDIYPLLDSRGELIPPEERFLLKAIAGREVVATRGYSVALLTRDGRRLPVSIAAAPILDPEGHLLGGVEILRDVSHEREVDRLKSSLISTVSHELRTPLTMIQGFSELLLSREVDEESWREAVKQINVSAGRLGQLIEDLLSVSRIESGRQEVRPGPVDVAGVVQQVSMLFARDREVRIEIDDHLPPVLADEELLMRILTNLVSNAVKYSPPRAPITVAAREGDGNIEVSVSDQGIGMSPAETKRLFEKFYRADRPEVRSATGTGLGLYITRNLVQMQGGDISAESEQGRGTTFRFTLPLARQDVRVMAS